MVEQRGTDRKRILDPLSRVSEILFGLIMVLTFTCSISAVEAGREEIRTILIGAISCNIAWGLVDAVMYLMSALAERARQIATVTAIRKSTTDEEAQSIISDLLPPAVSNILKPGAMQLLRERLNEFPDSLLKPRLRKEDWLGAIAVFLLVFLSTFPVVVPFVFMQNTLRALRISNLIAIIMLFITGHTLGKHAGLSPWKTGFYLVITGIVLVAITMALGG